MKVNNVSNRMMINPYNNINKSRNISKQNPMKDSCEISNIGKKLNNMSLDTVEGNSEAKVEKIKNQINNGTYKIDSKLVAEKMIEAMKGR
ncbi:flagellar biosynthesis anti-sigma factor FlgM [Clostridium ihumii]|uniref:flagellar biosynthesis anti-sigma factor FlgM n=1 Tax=Clostridium ihumii TaxID=1470356 RepID=UPI00058DA35A|nr:flagellar biosynthesis anti-sigma factor FlgM [Clostridium ihumii]